MEYFISCIYLCMNLLCSVTGAIVLYDYDTTVFPQVEIPGGRGKPASLVEKDDGVDKVAITFHFMP